MIPDRDERRAKRKELREESQRDLNRSPKNPNGELSPAYHDNPDGDKPMTIEEPGADKAKQGDANWSPNA